MSRSVSGTFHALPAEATYEYQEGDDDISIQTQQNLVQDRKEFCQTMLAQNDDKVIEKVQKSKVSLMDEIHMKVQKIPAVDEVFKPNYIQLKDPLVDFEALHPYTNDDSLYKDDETTFQKENTQVDRGNDLEHTLTSKETKYVDESIQVITIKEDSSHVSTTKESFDIPQISKVDVVEELKETNAVQIPNQPQEHEEDELIQAKSTSFKKSIKMFESSSKTPSTKWLQYETSPKEKVFSISGLWNKVSLGLVKERSSFWQGSQEQVYPFSTRTPPKTQNSVTAKRNSRLIDPNEWMAEECNGSLTDHQPLHKSVSMGQLDCEEDEKEVQLPVSQATVAFEQRANGRKSADIFVQNKVEEKISEENKVENISGDEKEFSMEEVPVLNKDSEVKEGSSTMDENKLNNDAQISPEALETGIPTEISHEASHQCVNTETVEFKKSTVKIYADVSSEKDELNYEEISAQSKQSDINLPINGHCKEQNPRPPQVPGRHSSKKVLKEKMQHHQKVSSPKAPVLTILNVETINSEETQRAKILAQHEAAKQKQIEKERKARQLSEQENKFYQKMETAQKYRHHQSTSVPVISPPPQQEVNNNNKSLMVKEAKRLERIKNQELKERMKLKEMERRKREIEEEILKEKQHLAQLLMLEKEPAIPLLQLPPSPPPPPVPPRPKQFEEESRTSVQLEEKSISETFHHDHQMSFTETFEDLENTTLKLKEMAEMKAAEQLKETAGVVKDVAQVLLKAVDTKLEDAAAIDEEEDMTEGYSEGAEDFSCGVELPFEQSSGNVTPIPTQGELEEIDTSNCSPRRTPLKSLLKRGWENDETLSLPEDLPSASIVTMRERSNSPRKAVHFSEVDQIKLMSQESLVSTAPSDKNEIVQSSSSQTCSATRMAKEAPCRNQLVSS